MFVSSAFGSTGLGSAEDGPPFASTAFPGVLAGVASWIPGLPLYPPADVSVGPVSRLGVTGSPLTAPVDDILQLCVPMSTACKLLREKALTTMTLE